MTVFLYPFENDIESYGLMFVSEVDVITKEEEYAWVLHKSDQIRFEICLTFHKYFVYSLAVFVVKKLYV